MPLGYQEDISGILGAADVLAGKCGTGYAMLSIAKGIPLIVTHIGAPNERENMLHIVENGHGWYCPRRASSPNGSTRSCGTARAAANRRGPLRRWIGETARRRSPPAIVDSLA